MSFSVTLCFDRELGLLLRERSPRDEFCVTLSRKAPLKDLVESLGIPHTEVGSMACGGRDLGFCHVPASGDEVSVRSPEVPVDVTRSDALHPVPVAEGRFIVDVNVERLGRLLRLAGFDAAPSGGEDDRRLASRARREGRVLLTRDRLLLMRKVVVRGRLVRSDRPWAQLAEVLQFFGLDSRMDPFTRCPVCNGLLEEVAAQEVWDSLEPLTRRYYRKFHRCPTCGRVYWAGSHRVRALERLDRARGQRGEWSGLFRYS